MQGLKHLDEQIRDVLKNDEKVLDLAKDLYQQKSLLIMGRGYNFATCMEGSLVRFFFCSTRFRIGIVDFSRL